MTKESKAGERIERFSTGFNSRKSATKSEHISGFDKIAPHVLTPIPEQENLASTRQKLIIPVGFTIVCLMTTVFVLARFQTASTAPVLTLLNSIPKTTNLTNMQDTQSPSVPGKLTATNAGDTTVNLAWKASSDNIGVVGYTIYRNGVSIATISGSDLTFRDTAAMPDTTYFYALDAYDQAGNRSAISAHLQVNTLAQPGNQILLQPEEDTYVNADNPSSTYGTAGSLRVDASPDVHAYLRFVVTGLNGKTITRARLMLYTKNGTAQSIQVRAVTGNSWSELGSDYDNAPALGDPLAFSPPANDAAWIAFDLTPYITGEGRFDFGLTTDGTTAVSLASREAGAEAPQLILDLRK
jgi:chitodextrinase